MCNGINELQGSAFNQRADSAKSFPRENIGDENYPALKPYTTPMHTGDVWSDATSYERLWGSDGPGGGWHCLQAPHQVHRVFWEDWLAASQCRVLQYAEACGEGSRRQMSLRPQQMDITAGLHLTGATGKKDVDNLSQKRTPHLKCCFCKTCKEWASPCS